MQKRVPVWLYQYEDEAGGRGGMDVPKVRPDGSRISAYVARHGAANVLLDARAAGVEVVGLVPVGRIVRHRVVERMRVARRVQEMLEDWSEVEAAYRTHAIQVPELEDAGRWCRVDVCVLSPEGWLIADQVE